MALSPAAARHITRRLGDGTDPESVVARRARDLIAECERIEARIRAASKRAKERGARAVSRLDKPTKRERTDTRAAIRALCVEREGGHCAIPDCNGDILHMDHFWGRAREESVESCWMLCADHDRQKTLNRPSRLLWIVAFQNHCGRHGYGEQQEKCDKAIALETAQHPEATP